MRSLQIQSFADGFRFSVQKMGEESIICLPHYYYSDLKKDEILDYFLAELELHDINIEQWLKENFDTNHDMMKFYLYVEITGSEIYPRQIMVFIRRRDWGISWDHNEQISRSFDE